MIDTAEKRFSIINLGVAGAGRALPVPSGSVTAPERYHFLGLYSGLAPTPPVGTGLQQWRWLAVSNLTLGF